MILTDIKPGIITIEFFKFTSPYFFVDNIINNQIRYINSNVLEKGEDNSIYFREDTILTDIFCL